MTEAYKPKPETIQSTKIMAWLNPDGTFTKIAADQYAIGEEDIKLNNGVSSIRGIFELVRDGSADLGIVPIENSTAGPVKDTHHAFTEIDDIVILGEVVIPIKHFLYMTQGVKNEDVREIRSKDQALLQCRDHIEQSFPRAILKEVNSTTEAVRQAAEDPTIAGIGSEIAAQALGIENKLRRISGFEDNPNNVTTFVVIGKKGNEIPPITGRDKTTFIVSIKNQPGSLFSLLSEFANQNINLTKIKSLISNDDDVIFLISIDGHENEEKIHSSLSNIEKAGIQIKRLGSYQKAKYSLSQIAIKPDIDRAAKMIQEEVKSENGHNNNKRVVVFTLLNQPSTLAKALEPFARRKINLTKIDSLPSGNFEEYVFYLSYDKKEEGNENESIQELSVHCAQLVILN